MDLVYGQLYVAVHGPTATLCVVEYNLLGSRVTFDGLSAYLTCEVGAISEFEFLSLFNETREVLSE
jgi:hypothetical protein